MEHLGLIISSSKTIPTYDFIRVSDDAGLINSAIPTLIIGKRRAESLYGADKVRILDRQIAPNIWWTYAKTERRDDFEDDVAAFNDRVSKLIPQKIDLQYRNPMTMGYTMAKRLINYFRSGRIRYVYLRKWHVYSCDGNVVMHMSLRDTEFIGVPWKKVLAIIYSNRCSVKVEDDSFLNYRTRKVIESFPAAIPYLFSLTQKDTAVSCTTGYLKGQGA